MRCVLVPTIVLLLSALLAAQTVDGAEPSKCPTFSVTAPAGVPDLTKPIYYYLDISGELPEGAEIFWTTTDGQILSGQGTKKIGIYNVGSTEITVVAHIKGLHEDCQNEASEKAVWVIDYTTQQLDEIENNDLRLDKDAVKKAIKRRDEIPNSSLFFIQYYRFRTDAFRVQKLKRELSDYLTKELKLKDPFFKIETKQAHKAMMTIFLVPPGVEDPTP